MMITRNADIMISVFLALYQKIPWALRTNSAAYKKFGYWEHEALNSDITVKPSGRNHKKKSDL